MLHIGYKSRYTSELRIAALETAERHIGGGLDDRLCGAEELNLALTASPDTELLGGYNAPATGGVTDKNTKEEAVKKEAVATCGYHVMELQN